MTDRNLVAARVVARDHGNLIVDGDLSVRLEARVVETMLRMANRSRYDGFHPTAYDASPLTLHSLPKRSLDVLRGITKNKRLLALIGLAVETQTKVSFVLPEDRFGKGVVKVDVDTADLVDAKPEALAFAEEYLRIELGAARQALVSRAGHSLSNLDFDAERLFSPGELPESPAGRVVAYLAAVSRFNRWIESMLSEEDSQPKMDIVDRLERRARHRRGANDHLTDLLAEAAAEIRRLRDEAVA